MMMMGSGNLNGGMRPPYNPGSAQMMNDDPLAAMLQNSIAAKKGLPTNTDNMDSNGLNFGVGGQFLPQNFQRGE
jgi:hypothetical protein